MRAGAWLRGRRRLGYPWCGLLPGDGFGFEVFGAQRFDQLRLRRHGLGARCAATTWLTMCASLAPTSSVSRLLGVYCLREMGSYPCSDC